MKLIYFFRKTALENLRDWKMLCIVIALGPFFIFLMHGYFDAADPAYHMVVVNEDHGSPIANGLVDAWRVAVRADGGPVFNIETADDVSSVVDKLSAAEVSLIVKIPKEFGSRLTQPQNSASDTVPTLLYTVDPANTQGAMAASFSDYIAYKYAFEQTGRNPPLDVSYASVKESSPLSDFDIYVPALLVLAIIMVLFTSAATIIKEREMGTMMRLNLSDLTFPQMMTAISLNQVIIAIVALAVSLGATYLIGYRPAGNVLSLLPVGALGALGVIAIGFITAAFLNTLFELLTVGVFPFFVLMFFSDCMFPLPKIHLFDVLSHPLYANDILPTALTVRAFNQLLNHNASYSQIGFELIALTLLSGVYFVVGVRLLRRKMTR